MRIFSACIFLSLVLCIEGGILLNPRVQRCGYNNPNNCPVFNYTNTQWGSLCAPYGQCSAPYQSPIDISGVNKGPGTPDTLNVLYAPFRVTLFNTGNQLLLPVPDYSGVFTQGGVVYALHWVEFHTPSEHSINGKTYDMEVVFVHKSADNRIANIAVLFEVGHNNPTLDPFWSSLPLLTNCSCGNGRFEPWMGEECDEGPRNSNFVRNACRQNCKWFTCGDGVVDASEWCDNGPLNSDSTPNACRRNCALPFCGDAVVDSNNKEQCDDGNNLSGDGCSSSCQIENTCGNGVVDFGEECDDGVLNSNTLPNACRLNCVRAHCGDGIQDATEECDAGLRALTTNSSNVCRTTCTLPICGDGIVDDRMGEECDDNTPNCDECRVLCGNGVIDGVGEQCDNGYENCNVKPNACRTNCSLPSCGDGVTDNREECDDGAANGVLGGRCSFNCSIVCGNGRVDNGEQCDNGALNSNTVPNACRVNCKTPVCGDNVVDNGEECDTAGPTAFCRANCRLPRCGDGVLDSFYGEECDDGNTNAEDGCNPLCQKECGNGVPNGAEQCDNGPLNSDLVRDGCRTDCTKSRCGDGVEDSWEECDLGALNSDTPNSCRLDCSLPYCGDGIIDPAYGELCDNGELNSDTVVDGCSTTCVPNQCRQSVTDAIADFGKLLPEKCESGFYTYTGSQTSPPCTPGVQWFIFGQTQTISKPQLALLQRAVGSNARPTQPLGLRVVKYPTDNPQRCGNGVREGLEECDDPAGNSDTEPNRCRTNCKLPSCGDGVADCGEECDGGSVCSQDCTFGQTARGNRTVVNMFFKDLVPFNYFCCNAQIPLPGKASCPRCYNP